MSEADALVLSYLTTVSEKLAKQFSKKRPAPAPWTGPGILQLIEFYRTHCSEESVAPPTAPETPAVASETPVPEPLAAPEPPQTNGDKKRGKKRKLSEMKEQVEQTTDQTPQPEKKKKKKKKKNGQIVPNSEVEKPDTTETPVVEKTETPEQTDATKQTESTEQVAVGGLVGAPAEENGEVNGVVSEENGEKKKVKKSKLKTKQNNSFRRVKEEEVEIKNEDLANNTFEAKGGADQYGFKANQILKFTKGKSFRHEKTKKKRGTYKGGAINMGVTSIRFDSD